MKKLLLLALLGLGSTTLFAQKIALGLNLEKGKTYIQDATIKMTVGQKVQGKDMNIDMDIAMVTKSEILDVVADIYKVKVNYQKMSMDMNAMGQTMSFGSDKDQDTPEANSANKIFAALCGKPFTMELTKKGKIVSVKGLDSLVNGLIESMPTDATKGILSKQLTASFGEKAFVKNFELGTDIFPNEMVAPGDTWEKSGTIVSGGMEMVYKNNLKYTGSTTSGNNIEIKGTMGTKASEEFIEKDGIKMKIDMNGSVNTSLSIDKTTGWTLSSTAIMDINGTNKIKSPAMGEMSIPMVIKGTTTITTK
jgi:hypothetical protein